MFIKIKKRFVFKQVIHNQGTKSVINEDKNPEDNFAYIRNIIIFISLLATVSGIIYRIYALNFVGAFFSVIIAFFLYFIILRHQRKYNQGLNWQKYLPNNLNDWLFPAAYLLISTACFFLLFLARTDVALISPWEVVRSSFFLFYFLATAILFISAVLKSKNFLLLLSIHFFLSFSVALIVYKLGYGYDAFVHEATMSLIDQAGSVTPKPFYYLGYYGIIITLHKFLFIPISFLNKIIVPLLAAALLPSTFYYSFQKHFGDRNSFKLAILFLLILPFSIFILSTPQNLAFLFLFLIIILSAKQNHDDEYPIILLALATFIIHPIAGIPAIIFASINSLYLRDMSINIKKSLIILAFLALCFALPTAFYLSNQTQNSVAATQKANIAANAPYLSWLIPHFPAGQSFILNFVYLFKFNINTIFLALVAFGIYLARNRKSLYLYFLCPAFALLSAYFFTSALNFNYLIAYEREDFANRIIIMSSLFLIPFVILALQKIIEKIFLQDKFVKVALFIFLIIIITTSVYSSYPRRDNFFNSHGVSTNKNDMAAVNWIENDAQDQDYIVLANQQVSAAALYQFGFKKYYHDDIFFYPVPTGGPLYQYYLKMVYEHPNQENIKAAMDLTDVKLGYFVLNKYWWAFPKILEEAQAYSQSWEKIGNGDVYVFKYVSDN